MSCVPCDLIKEKKPVYQDEKAVVFFSSSPLSKGHLQVFSREHYSCVEEVSKDDMLHLFYVASFASTAIFELLNSGQNLGTNIVFNEGSISQFGHLCLDIIPRTENDGIPFRWEPKPADPKDLDDVLKKVKDEAFFIGKERAPENEIIEDDVEPTIIQGSEENYLVRQLRRIP